MIMKHCLGDQMLYSRQLCINELGNRIPADTLQLWLFKYRSLSANQGTKCSTGCPNLIFLSQCPVATNDLWK